MNSLFEIYFRPKKWEGTGKIYEILGVLIFKKVIVKLGRFTGQKSSKPNNYYLWQKDKEGIQKYERKTRYNEIMHLIGIILPSIGLVKGVDDPVTIFILWFVLIINIYPFLLQRFNRIRIYRILNQKNKV
ncbi:MAG: hypothetical protein NXI23_14195 [Bacteroidetes bacterium]|jgi:hypothetical protein|nr:hypothetical protein [Bacteroidota bacterium]MDF1865597.1 hypothetical protein [Saprospiraceae bacterium]